MIEGGGDGGGGGYTSLLLAGGGGGDGSGGGSGGGMSYAPFVEGGGILHALLDERHGRYDSLLWPPKCLLRICLNMASFRENN